MKNFFEIVGILFLPAIFVFVALVFLQSFDMVFFDNAIFNFLEELTNEPQT